MLLAIYGDITDEQELKTYLLDNSPLSKEVLQAYMLRYNVPAEYFYEVYSINSVIDAGLYDLLKDRVKDFPAAIKDEILNTYVENPHAETLVKQARILHQAQKMYQAAWIEHLNLLKKEGNEQMLVDKLEESNSVFDQFQLVDYYANKEMHEQATDLLNTIKNKAPELALLVELKKAILMNNPDPIPALTNSWINSGDNAFSQTTALYSSFMQSMGQETPMFITSNSSRPEPRSFEYFEVKNTTEALVYPNPAQNYVRIKLPSAIQDGESILINIYSSSQKLVFTQEMTKQEEILIELNNLPTGVYTFLVTSDNNDALSGSFIKR
ncbi:MAG: T9SS type A sorting domain-containing protein [Flavobacteriales bacterium]|nr:T9SS type A sorting domain-containing protein [Flavobacteriales bacterium]